MIKNNSFEDIDLKNSKNLEALVTNLKTIYEDFWKDNNLINTSINLSLSIRVDNKDYDLSSKFDKNFIFYSVIFNGTPQTFINIMEDQNYNFDTQKKTWILK